MIVAQLERSQRVRIYEVWAGAAMIGRVCNLYLYIPCTMYVLSTSPRFRSSLHNCAIKLRNNVATECQCHKFRIYMCDVCACVHVHDYGCAIVACNRGRGKEGKNKNDRDNSKCNTAILYYTLNGVSIYVLAAQATTEEATMVSRKSTVRAFKWSCCRYVCMIYTFIYALLFVHATMHSILCIVCVYAEYECTM